MNRRWIRIDLAHATFDCSPGEFDSVLLDARSGFDSIEADEQTHFSPDELMHRVGDDFTLQESINAELAMLAALQRRERFLQKECKHSDEVIARKEQAEKLATLHASMLRRDE